MLTRKLGLAMPSTLHPVPAVCPVGKHCFPTKKDASAAAARINRTQRTPMRPFRCGYGDHFHLGHVRGSIY